MVKVVPLTGPLANAGKNRNTTVLHGDVVYHFHHDNGFTDPGAPEHSHLAATGERYEQIDDLDTGFENTNRRILFRK